MSHFCDTKTGGLGDGDQHKNTQNALKQKQNTFFQRVDSFCHMFRCVVE